MTESSAEHFVELFSLTSEMVSNGLNILCTYKKHGIRNGIPPEFHGKISKILEMISNVPNSPALPLSLTILENEDHGLCIKKILENTEFFFKTIGNVS